MAGVAAVGPPADMARPSTASQWLWADAAVAKPVAALQWLDARLRRLEWVWLQPPAAGVGCEHDQ